MKLSALRKICLGFPAAVEDVKWGADVTFCVGEKMFACTGMDGGSVSLKATREAAAQLVELPGISPAPYLARYDWVLIEAGALPPAQLKELLANSYELVRDKLPKKKRAALGC